VCDDDECDVNHWVRLGRPYRAGIFFGGLIRFVWICAALGAAQFQAPFWWLILPFAIIISPLWGWLLACWDFV
jgi:hypothetical protein